MFFSILKWVLISLTLIFLMHHLYMFLMNTLTVPKIKDLVNKPTQQYNEMLGVGGTSPQTPPLGGSQPTQTLNEMGGVGAQPPLTDELSSFLSDLKKKNTSTVGPGSLGPNAVGPTDKFPSTLGTLGGEMSYSLF